jgi:glyoxylase-like metal-dependent hydrolase (beta-lactamase superfamily II)
MRRLLGFAAAAALLSGPVLAHDDHHDRKPDDPFTVVPLRGGVHALYGRGGNVGFFVGPDAVIVVDSQFKDLAPGIVEKIKGVTDKPIRYLLNTHHHGDHTGGNEVFRHFAVIVAHDNVRRRMLASPDASAPTRTFDSERRFHVEGTGETVHLWHVPASHTDGDAVVFFEKANVLHTGDVFFNEVIPVIDVSAGGTPAGYLAAIDKVIARVPKDVVLIPGHGVVSDVAGLKRFRQYIEDLVDAARKAKGAGTSREEFVKSVELPAYKAWKGYPDRFRMNAGAAYDELK